MDQTVGLSATDRQRELGGFDRIYRPVGRGGAGGRDAVLSPGIRPRVPRNIYAAMLAAMPSTSDYRRMSGRRKVDVREDGTPTRVKIDLFPEYIRSLPPEKRSIWDLVGRALCAREVQAAFVRRLAPTFARRFGPGYADVGLYPLPILTRDVPGYKNSANRAKALRSRGSRCSSSLPRDESAHQHRHDLLGAAAEKRGLTRDQMHFRPRHRLCVHGQRGNTLD